MWLNLRQELEEEFETLAPSVREAFEEFYRGKVTYQALCMRELRSHPAYRNAERKRHTQQQAARRRLTVNVDYWRGVLYALRAGKTPSGISVRAMDNINWKGYP